MKLRRTLLMAVATIALIAPVVASADPEWGGRDEGDHGGWRQGDDRGEHEGEREGWRGGDREWNGGEGERSEWREHERSEQLWGDGYGYYQRCFWVNRGFYNAWGRYVSRPVQVCR